MGDEPSRSDEAAGAGICAWQLGPDSVALPATHPPNAFSMKGVQRLSAAFAPRIRVALLQAAT